MAARKRFAPREPVRHAQSYAEFMAALLDARIAPTRLYVQVKDGRLELDYEEDVGKQARNR